MSKFNCDCIEKVDDYLGKKNTRITQALVLDPNSQSPGVMIETEQVETGRGKPKAVGMFASHCPFCGMKYGEIKGIDLTEGMLSLSWRIIHALTVHGFENDADISKLLDSHQPLILTAIKNAFNDTATNPYKAELEKLADLVGEKDDPFAAWEKLQPIVEASAGAVTLTEWESSVLSWHAGANAMTYLGHHQHGGLRGNEIEEMDKWVALSKKLERKKEKAVD